MKPEKSETIKLYPSNWLYNAGVVGFLRVVEACGENVNDFLKNDGSVEVKLSIFAQINVEELYFGENRVSSIVGNSPIYRNYLQPSWKPAFKKFVSKLEELTINHVCDICGDGRYIDQSLFNNDRDKESILKFLSGIRNFDVRLNNYLAPSLKFPNSFWNNEASIVICDLCGYILIHHHLSLTKLADNSEIFINAPSFKLMWYLNNYAQIYEREEIRKAKELLGISMIELASKLYIQLGKWEKMNIEIVCKYRERKNNQWEDKIEFFTLPAEVVDLLSDREIATTLKEIGEFKILNMILDRKFKEIVQFGERLLKIGLKPINERGKQERDFVNQNVKLERNSKHLIHFSQKLFKLYTLIDSKIKREVYYGFQF